MKKLVLTLLIGVTTLTAFSQVPSYVPTNGLVGYWPFNGNANDESGNGNNGKLLNFDGTNFITITDFNSALESDRFGKKSSSLLTKNYASNVKLPITNNLFKSNFTFSIWSKIDSIKSEYPSIVESETNNFTIQYTNFNNELKIGSYMTVNNISPFGEVISPITYKNWNLITVVNENFVNKFYINGKLVYTAKNSNENQGQSISNFIRVGNGIQLPQCSFYGMTDDISIYNRALTQQEITALYQGCSIPPASITPQSTTTFCQGGSVILNASAGSGYTYEWYKNGTIINGSTTSSYTANQSGSYTVKVINGSCNATSSATTVTVNPNPTATITPQGIITICQNGFVALNASTGTGYTYEWYKDDNIINGSTTSYYKPNQSGSYTVKVINGSCNATSSATTVTVNPNPTAAINAAGVSTFCQGGSVVLNASTGSGYTYEWYKNGNIINGSITSAYIANQSGSYTVKVINGSCNATSSATTVTVNPNPTVSLSLANFIHIKASPVTLAGSPSGGTYSGAGVVGSTFSSTNAGLGKKTITYNYTSGAGCSVSATAITTVYDTTACSTFDTLFINIAVAGLTAPNNLGTLKIWQNPANDRITIDNGNYGILSGYSVKIETVLGQEVFKSAINQQQFSVDLSTWNGKGIYLVHILDNQNNIIETKKIVLQ